MSEQRKRLTIVAELAGVVGTIAGIVFGIITALAPGRSGPPPQPRPSPGTATVVSRIVPMQLKNPDFDGYCHATGQGNAYVDPANHNAYGWKCSSPNPAIGDDAQAVCVWSNGGAAKIINRVADFSDPNSWQCWSSNGELGPLDWNTYCQVKGLGQARDNGTNTVYTWTCTGSEEPLDSQDACLTLYGTSPPISRFQNYYDPNSWQCWG